MEEERGEDGVLGGRGRSAQETGQDAKGGHRVEFCERGEEGVTLGGREGRSSQRVCGGNAFVEGALGRERLED